MIDLEPDADPPKALAIGPDPAGNSSKSSWLELADDVELVIHAMALRSVFLNCSHQGRTRTNDHA